YEEYKDLTESVLEEKVPFEEVELSILNKHIEYCVSGQIGPCICKHEMGPAQFPTNSFYFWFTENHHDKQGEDRQESLAARLSMGLQEEEANEVLKDSLDEKYLMHSVSMTPTSLPAAMPVCVMCRTPALLWTEPSTGIHHSRTGAPAVPPPGLCGEDSGEAQRGKGLRVRSPRVRRFEAAGEREQQVLRLPGGFETSFPRAPKRPTPCAVNTVAPALVHSTGGAAFTLLGNRVTRVSNKAKPPMPTPVASGS
ncbi:hypothetical protein Celaphus_00002078, partial [Cervus elaphus hippelaphus]